MTAPTEFCMECGEVLSDAELENEQELCAVCVKRGKVDLDDEPAEEMD